jgi:RimJ/RimL family protein N-acetyltransferase
LRMVTLGNARLAIFYLRLMLIRKPGRSGQLETQDDLSEIRPITDNDLEEVLEVYRQCEDFLSLGPEPKASMALVLQDIETSRQEKGVFCGVYAPDGRIVGVVDFVPADFEGMAHLAFITLIMIVPASRNRGIGTRILKLVEDRIGRTSRINEIHTAVQLNNPAALRFWQRNNYCVFGDPEFRPDQTMVSYLRKDLSTSD